jgi:GR25 family glycosyltransferase involved in LPS biosynthesis
MRINIISLSRTPERLVSFRRRNNHLLDIEVFEAIDGLKLSRSDLKTRGIIEETVRYTPGALGNLMSHITQWDRAASCNQATTICEDDAIFNSKFENLAPKILSRLPDDTDIVYWGWNLDALLAIEMFPGLPPVAVQFGRNPDPIEIPVIQRACTNPTAFRLIRAFGTVCYTITPKGVRLLRGSCLPVRDEIWYFPEINLRMPNAALDVVMAHAFPSIRAFVCFPPLVVSLNDERQSTVQTDELVQSGRVKPARNALCPCGSGRRYKHCCGAYAA